MNLRNLCCLLVLAASALFGGASVYAQETGALNVLVLNSYERDSAPYSVPRNVFMLELQKQSVVPIAFHQFDLEQRTASEPGRAKLLGQLLNNEFSGVRPDLVVTMGGLATTFWLQNRAPNLLEIPSIAVAADFTLANMDFMPGDSAVTTPFSFRDAVKDFLELVPDTSHILMIFGASDDEQRLTNLAKFQLRDFADRIDFEYTNQWQMTALLKRLAELEAGSAVFMGLYESDVDGVLFNQYSGLPLICENSNVPVFGAFSDQLGQGIVGGRLIQLEQMGKAIAANAQRLLTDKPANGIWTSVEIGPPTYDWRALQEWGVDSAHLPTRSVIRFKPPGLWATHGGWIVGIALVGFLQSLLIISLVVLNRRRRLAELANKQLGRKLITSHEDERRFLARELHDDLSQRLARLAIDTSFVTSSPDKDETPEVLDNLYAELVNINKYVHDMSYRLHPALIEDLGLAAALHTELQRVRRYSNAEIIDRVENIKEQVAAGTALCVYRIAQEAVNNAIKHAGAATIEVKLKADRGMLFLRVSDDGVGFNPAKHSVQTGLGLSSMRERAQLAGGSLELHSHPGKGTTLTAVVPVGETRS